MTSKIKYQKNYTEFNETYQLVLPLSLEDLVPDDDSVRLLSHELEELDYTLLYKAYSSKGRNPAVDPKTIVQDLTYAYSQKHLFFQKNRKSLFKRYPYVVVMVFKAPVITARLPGSGQVFFWRHVKICFIRWFVD